MNRRTFNKLAGLSAVGTMAESISIYAQGNSVAMTAQTGTGEEIVLEDKELLVAFDKTSGALMRKSTNWVIQRRPELGVSFRMLVRLPKQRANFVLGQKQRAASVQKVSGNRVEIIWKDPVSEHGGIVPLTLTATAELENGVLAFEATLVNDSGMTVETIDYP